MGTYHYVAHVPVAQQLLDSPYVLSPFQQVCCLTWPKANVAEPLGIPRWWRPWMPDSLSCQRFCWGNTHCQTHSRSAFGYLRASAYGICTRPQPAVYKNRPNSGLEPIQRRGYHPMVRVLLELLQQEARLVGLGFAGPVAHQAAQDFGAAHPHRSVGIFDCQGG